MLANDVTLPAITVYHDGQDHWLADGFHRYKAMELTGRAYIEAAITEGSFRDALLFSSCANGIHGLNRTNADKRKAVINLLNDAEWKTWSDRAIARKLNVSPPLVAEVRASLKVNQSCTVNSFSTSNEDQETSPRVITVNTIEDTRPEMVITPRVITERVEPKELTVAVVTDMPQERTYTRNGQVKTMQVGNIGKKPKREPSQDSNDAEEEPVDVDELYGDELDLTAELEAALKRNERLEKEVERLRKAIDQDTQAQQIEKLNAMQETLMIRLHSQADKLCEYAKDVKYWKQRALRVEKQSAAAGLVDF